jgi:DNA repair protein SbcC/Rad50
LYRGGLKLSKEIVLKRLSLKNFKGIKELTVDFSKVTSIYGENATGKTTLFDSFMWLMFDKDSQDRSSFEIKTLDSNNNVIHGLEHQVSGILSIDARDITLTKIYKEKWTKKRGEAERELTGHETLYYIDEVPVKKSEYQEKVSSIVNEQLFKLISNPLYFSINMKWQDRRKVLLDIIGDITPDRIINYRSDLRPLDALLVDKDIDTLKKSIQSRKRKLNEDIKSLPYRIDELHNSIKEYDFEALEIQKNFIVSGIKAIEEQLADSSKVNEESLKVKQKLFELKSKYQDLQHKAIAEAEKPMKEIERKIQQNTSDLYKHNSKINIKSSQIDSKRSLVTTYQNEMAALREEWGRINQEALNIPEDSFICPTCQRPFEEHDIEHKKDEMLQNFNSNKAVRLRRIQEQGKAFKEKAEKLNNEIAALETEIQECESIVESFKNTIAELENSKANLNVNTITETTELHDLGIEIRALEEKLQQPVTAGNNYELKSKKIQLERELLDIDQQLFYKERNKESKERIAQLMDDEKALAQQIAALEGQEFLCEEFVKTKVELLESSINSKFKFVSFKLFDTQVNGGLTETCEALIDGVPFSNANTASQINAGMDIINALCDYYSVLAPVFIDNRESINNLIETDSQVINLIVSKDKTLRIESED